MCKHVESPKKIHQSWTQPHASWWTDADEILENSPSGGGLYYEGPTFQKIIPVLFGSPLIEYVIFISQYFYKLYSIVFGIYVNRCLTMLNKLSRTNDSVIFVAVGLTWKDIPESPIYLMAVTDYSTWGKTSFSKLSRPRETC